MYYNCYYNYFTIIIIIIIIEANLMLHGLKKACRGISPDILRSGK